MASRTDSTRILSEAKICEIVGVSQQYRQSLVKRKLIEPTARRRCSRTDAIELAAIERLSQHLTPTEVTVAWRQLGPQVRDTVPRGQIDVVFDRALGIATLVRSDAGLRAAVTSGRSVNVLELGRRLEEVLDAFTRWAEATATPAGQTVRPRRQPRSA
jgi:hypothetical protein